MKTQNKRIIEFTKSEITELNQDQISNVKGGTVIGGNGTLSCSFCINSSNGGGGQISIKDIRNEF